jgi:hypothetical protein
MLKSTFIKLLSSLHAFWLAVPSIHRLSRLSVPIKELELKLLETNVV